MIRVIFLFLCFGLLSEVLFPSGKVSADSGSSGIERQLERLTDAVKNLGNRNTVCECRCGS